MKRRQVREGGEPRGGEGGDAWRDGSGRGAAELWAPLGSSPRACRSIAARSRRSVAAPCAAPPRPGGIARSGSVRAGCRPRVWLRRARCRACPRFCRLSAFRRFVPMGTRVFWMRLRCGSGEQSGAELLPSERQPAVPPHGSALLEAAQVGSVRAGRRWPRDGAGGETLLGAPRASAALLSVPADRLTPAGRLGGSALSLVLRYAWNGPHCRRGFRGS